MQIRLLSALAACAVAVAVMSSAPASGATVRAAAWGRSPATAELPALVSPTAASWTPNVFAGSPQCNIQWFGPTVGTDCAPSTVYATAVVNGEVVVAGAFTQVCAPGPASDGQCAPGTLVTRNDIFAYQLGTGTIDPNFAPVLDQGPVTALAAGPGNTVYAGGSFTAVNGTPHEGVVQLSVAPGSSADGQVVPAFAGQLHGNATTLAWNGNALYIGGQFGSADAKPASGIVRLDATTGALDPSFSFTLSSPISGTALQVGTMSLSTDGSHLVIGGTFLQVDGRAQPRMAMIETGGGIGGTATLANWSSPLFANNCSKEHDWVRGLSFSPDGSFFVVATTGYKSAGGPSICDASARFETAATGTNILPAWVNYTGGDTFRSVAVAGSVVYLGGHQRWMNNECGNNNVCEANAVLVDGIAAVDANTGLALPWWTPGTLRGVGVDTLTVFPAGAAPGLPGGLILGTNTDNIGGAFHGENAVFPLTTTTAQAPGGPIPSGLFSQGRIGGLDESTAGVAPQCVTDANGSLTNGSKVVFFNCWGGASQNWTVEPDGTIRINGNMCLDVAGNSKNPPDGARIQIWSCNGATTQHWRAGPGNTLVNQSNGTCLDDPNATNVNGTQLQMWSCDGRIRQIWPLPVAQAPPPPPATGSVYSPLQNKSNVPCLTDANGSSTPGTAVQLWDCSTLGAPQDWTIEADGTIRTGGLCLDTAGGTADGTPVVLNTCNGSASQVWTQGSNRSLVNKATNKCLDDPASNTIEGTPLDILTCNAGMNQEWRLPSV